MQEDLRSKDKRWQTSPWQGKYANCNYKKSLDAKFYSLFQQQWTTNLESSNPYNTMHTLRS